MESFLKADIFFFVTTVSICIVTSLLVMILVEVLRIVRDVRYITDTLKREAENISSDFSAFRKMLGDTQFGFKPVFDGIKKTMSAFSFKSKPTRKKKDEA